MAPIAPLCCLHNRGDLASGRERQRRREKWRAVPIYGYAGQSYSNRS